MGTVVAPILAHGVSSNGFGTANLQRLSDLQTGFEEELTILPVRHAEDEWFSPIDGVLDHSHGILRQHFQPPTVEILDQKGAPRSGYRCDLAQGFLHSLFRDVHADAFANVVGLASGLETGTVQYFSQAFPSEIDRGIDEVAGRAAQSR